MGLYWAGGPRGEPGDRTVAQQMTGLDQLWPRVPGRFVLDVGSAEGAIALACCRKGASYVEGWEIRPHAVGWAQRLALADEAPARFYVVDVDRELRGARRFDVILLLAILHKLRRPEVVLDDLLRMHAEGTCCVVLRLRSSDWPVMRDPRSKHRPVDLRAIMREHEFTLVHEDDGPAVNDQPPEWVGIFERKATTS